ncbi:hypothetical protein ACRS9D_05205 [Pseudomonas aeruginosa]|uniref:hypothetical protein n=1 Tax=Pseudomonas aeruginosa TaxID=287 RepID=UPI003EE3941D|nr:hypothetical protein [Pseudomonas aeruginosa]
MSIDWSKAPEGATHWEPKSYYFTEGWMRKVGNEWSFWSEVSESWVRGTLTCNVSAEREATFEAKPQDPWNGQGLPPVGTVCEYRHLIWPEYRPCEIRYISEESLVAYDDAQEQFYRTCDMLFRPVRSPEQIAAAERWAAIQQMLAFADVKYGAGELMSPKEYVETAVAALYDAGYRRQEEGK